MSTGKKPASLAGRSLQRKGTSKNEKTVAASDLAQAPKRKKPKSKNRKLQCLLN
ncbi:MAG: hypothetical protein HWD59_07865 [Coxiellaceae bacterium]|nr:MAG: hypothetical protein HWD59_07865 [Coxiellaceae bacterium]